jgi:hypothetical protein
VARTLTDEDVDAIADRVVALIAKRLNAPAPTVIAPPPAPVTLPKATKLAYTKKELAEELSMSPASIWRLEQRGLLKSVPGLRTKLYSRREVDRYLNECEKRIL